MTGTDWAAVGELVRYGMRQHAMGQVDLARASGMSVATVRPLQQGQPGNYRERTLSKLDVAFGWEPGTIARVRDGTPVGDVIPELARATAAESTLGYTATAIRREVDALDPQQQEFALVLVRALRRAGPLDALRTPE